MTPHFPFLSSWKPTEIVWRKARTLTPHPALLGLPEMPAQSDELKSFAADVAREGVLPVPAIITPSGRIADGRDRVKVCAAADLDVPCVVTPRELTDDEVIMISARCTQHRKHFTAGQIAFMYYPKLEQAHQAAIAAHEAWIHSDKGTSAAAEVPPRTTQQLADDLGVSRDTFDRAATIHDLLAQYAGKLFKFAPLTLRNLGLNEKKKHPLEAVFVPAITRRHKPVGLGAAHAGMRDMIETQYPAKGGPKAKGGGKTISQDKQLQLFTRVWEDECVRWEYWEQFDTEQREAHWETLKESLGELTVERRQAMLDYHKRLVKTLAASVQKTAEELS